MADSGFQGIVDHSALPLAVATVGEGRYLYANRAFCELFGLDRDRIRSYRTLDLYWDKSERPTLLARAEKPGGLQQLQMRLKRADGSLLWAALSVATIEFEGQPAYLSTVFDLTPIRAVESALQASERRFQEATEGAGVGVYELRLHDGELTWSGGIATLFGASAPPSDRDHLVRGMHPEDRPAFEVALAAVAAGGTMELEYRYGPDDALRWHACRASAARGADGDVDRVVGVVHDVTARRRAEAERAEIEQQVQRSHHLTTLGTLAGGIAHDLNNLLQPVLTYARLVGEDLPSDSPHRDDLDVIGDAARRARDLVRRVLTFSRRTPSDPAPVCAQAIARECLKLIQASADPSITIELEAPETRLVMADATQLHQLLMNICANAQQAMSGGPAVLTIAITDVGGDPPDALPPGDWILLRVADTGVGMDAATRERIFEPFFTTRDVGEGVGLGLSVVHGIVEAHAGHLRVDSEPGRGTEFRVYLPVAEEARDRVVVKTRLEVAVDATVLLVDDDDEVRASGERTLARLGCRVQPAGSVEQAVKVLQSHPAQHFDIVVTDRAMPGLSGTDLARFVRDAYGLPVLMASGHATDIPQATLDELAIRAVLHKPYTPEELSEAIRRVLEA